MKRSTIIEIISILFMILFLYTGISKMMDYKLFKEQLANSPITAPVSSIIVWVIPLTEIIIAIALLIPNWRLKGLYASTFIMAAFTIYVIVLISGSSKLPSRTVGITEELSWPQHIIINIIFTILAICALVLHRLSIRSKITNNIIQSTVY